MDTLNRLKITKLLSFRLFFIILLLSIAVFSIYTYISIKHLTDSLMSDNLDNAQRIGNLIKQSTRYSMLLNRREDVYEIMKTIKQEPNIDEIRLINKKGEIVFSTNPDDINKSVDMNAEACYSCHSDINSLKNITEINRTRIFSSSKGHRILGLIEPIRNERDCSTSDCHAHPKEKTILGVLDIKIDLQKLDETISRSTDSLINISIIVIAVILLLFLISITVYVHIPIRKLYIGTREIANGNLDYQIDLKSGNEIGLLANSFNKMIHDLKRASNENTEWANTLEKKVDEKTKELKKVQSQITQVEKMVSLGKLSATVAHELNNPLAGMLNYAKLIIKRLSAETITDKAIKSSLEDLKIISDEIQRLGNIVRNLLLFSKMREANFVNDKLSLIIDGTIALVKHHLEVNNIRLEKNFEVYDDSILCEPQHIKQALLAIFINAVEAMSGSALAPIEPDCRDLDQRFPKYL